MGSVVSDDQNSHCRRFRAVPEPGVAGIARLLHAIGDHGAWFPRRDCERPEAGHPGGWSISELPGGGGRVTDESDAHLAASGGPGPRATSHRSRDCRGAPPGRRDQRPPSTSGDPSPEARCGAAAGGLVRREARAGKPRAVHETARISPDPAHPVTTKNTKNTKIHEEHEDPRRTRRSTKNSKSHEGVEISPEGKAPPSRIFVDLRGPSWTFVDLRGSSCSSCF